MECFLAYIHGIVFEGECNPKVRTGHQVKKKMSGKIFLLIFILHSGQ